MVVSCGSCGRDFEAKRSTAKYCGATCRKRASDRAKAGKVTPLEQSPPPAGSPLVEATRRELEAAGRLDSVLGQQALRLAERVATNRFDTGSAVAALSRELRAVMAEALADAVAATDSLDELSQRRARKAAGA